MSNDNKRILREMVAKATHEIEERNIDGDLKRVVDNKFPGEPGWLRAKAALTVACYYDKLAFQKADEQMLRRM